MPRILAARPKGPPDHCSSTLKDFICTINLNCPVTEAKRSWLVPLCWRVAVGRGAEREGGPSGEWRSGSRCGLASCRAIITPQPDRLLPLVSSRYCFLSNVPQRFHHTCPRSMTDPHTASGTTVHAKFNAPDADIVLISSE